MAGIAASLAPLLRIRLSSRDAHIVGSSVTALVVYRSQVMDVVFVGVLVVLYAVTHWLITAVSHLGSSE
jgi:hypothetical protein